MDDFEILLSRWQSAGVLDATTADKIRAYESRQERPAGLRWQGMVVLLLGALLVACGVVLFVSAHWGQFGPGVRFALIAGMVALFHLVGAVTRPGYGSLSTALHAAGTVSTGAAIALVGQIFNIQEHWPAAVLLWALAALAGWILLRDEAQQTLTLLLFPAWLLSEFLFHAEGQIGESVYAGRFLIVWALLYLTVFLGSRRKAVEGILFAAAAIAGIAGVVLTLESWNSWSGEQTFLPLGTRLWAWGAIACLPLFFSVFRLRKSSIPVLMALLFALALPWCMGMRTGNHDYGGFHRSYSYAAPNWAAHALVGLFALFICWWGVRCVSRALVNLGIVYFALAVGWFYFSDIFDKVGRSLGLILMGILFLAGGWALEKARRRLLAGMEQEEPVLSAPVVREEGR